VFGGRSCFCACRSVLVQPEQAISGRWFKAKVDLQVPSTFCQACESDRFLNVFNFDLAFVLVGSVLELRCWRAISFPNGFRKKVVSSAAPVHFQNKLARVIVLNTLLVRGCFS